MSADQLRQAVRNQLQAALGRRQANAATTQPPAAAQAAVVVPLRLRHMDDGALLTQLFKRLAATPSLLQMVDAGLLRFDLQVDASAVQALGTGRAEAPPLATGDCCDGCRRGNRCEGGDACSRRATSDHAPAVRAALLKGVVGERQVKALAPAVQVVRLDPKAVLTPLGKEALRRRGITIEKGGASS